MTDQRAIADRFAAAVFFGTQGYPMLRQVDAERLKTWADWQDLAVEAHGHAPAA